MPKETKHCIICSKKRLTECAHIDCPNRKRVTADESGEVFHSLPTTGKKYAISGNSSGRRAFVPDED